VDVIFVGSLEKSQLQLDSHEDGIVIIA